MKLTISKIAKMANVSRGTVDRVLHDRGDVSKETKDKINAIIEEYGYQPNAIGRALAGKKSIKIGVIIIQKDLPFFNIIKDGMQDAINIYKDYLVELDIRELSDLNEDEYLKTLEDLNNHCQALALIGYDTFRINNEVKKIIEKGQTVITLNVDLPTSKRSTYVGIDNYQAGVCMAALVNDIYHHDKKILLMGGHPNSKNEIDRIKGFKNMINKDLSYDIIYTQDKINDIYKITKNSLNKNNYDVIVNAGYGTYIMSDVVTDMHLDIKVFGFDILPENEEYLKSGKIAYLLDQQTYFQGYLPICYLCEYILHHKPIPQEDIYLPITINNRYNFVTNFKYLYQK